MTTSSVAPSLFRIFPVAVIATIVCAGVFEFLPLSGVSVRVVAILAMAIFAVSAWRARSVLLSQPYRTLVPTLLAATVIVAASFVLVDGVQPRSYALLGSVGPTLMGWALFFWLLPADDVEGGRDWSTWEPPRWAVPTLLVVAAALLTGVHYLSVGKWAVVSDEVIYLLQSEWIWNRDYAWLVDRDLLPFLQMRKLGTTPSGGLYGMYTPGWPAILALFDLVGLRWWSGIILGTASVYVTYRLGARLHSRAVGLLAAALLAVQPWFVLLHAGYMAHAATILAVALAALWLLEAETETGWRRTLRWLGVGVALAVAVTVRTVTGVAVGASLALWIVLRQRMSLGEMVRCAVTVVIGAAPIAAWFFHYNLATNGDPLRVSYQALHGTGYNLGFGRRGFTVFDEQMRRVQIPVTFTPRDAIGHLLQRLAGINFTFLPYALLAPMLVALAAQGYRPRWKVVAAFLVLPALYFFYWGSEIRFYSEFLPLLLVWIAAGALTIARARPRLAAGLVAAAFTGSLIFAMPERWSRIVLDEPWTRSGYTGSPARFALFETLDETQRTRGKLLVFVRERTKSLDVLIDRVYQFNADGLESRVLVVRDRGNENARLIERFPDRVPLLLEDRGRNAPASITELPRANARQTPIAR